MIDWRTFDYADRAATAPPHTDSFYWVMEEFYNEGVPTLGYYDGQTWRLADGSDDCSVTHWAPIEPPGVPS